MHTITAFVLLDTIKCNGLFIFAITSSFSGMLIQVKYHNDLPYLSELEMVQSCNYKKTLCKKPTSFDFFLTICFGSNNRINTLVY